MFKHIILLLFICLISCGGGFKDYSAVPIDQVDFLNDSETKTENNISVTTSVLTDKESNDIFGVDLFRKGIQPVWISITNNAEESYAFLPISVDPDYFAPMKLLIFSRDFLAADRYIPSLVKDSTNMVLNLKESIPAKPGRVLSIQILTRE